MVSIYPVCDLHYAYSLTNSTFHCRRRIGTLARMSHYFTFCLTSTFDTASQDCYPRETVGLSSVCRVHLSLTASGFWRRYSNTLLVSLNNRISIREASVCGAGVAPLAVTVPITSHPRLPSGIVRMELGAPEAALEAWPSGDSAGKRKGSDNIRSFGEQYNHKPLLFFNSCLTYLVL